MHVTLQAVGALALQAQSPQLTAYLDLAEATLRQPVTRAELERAALSPEGVASIRGLFEQSLQSGIALAGELVTPELGGEAMLHEDGLELVVYPDPIHPVVRELAELSPRPDELLRRLESSETGRYLLDHSGGLHAILYQLSQETTPERLAILSDVVRNTVATHFKTWTTDPEIQADLIEQTRWRGRYVGFWHLHPPRIAFGELAEGIEPSPADRENARRLGQFLTLVFQPGGFDVYDLSPLARAGGAAESLPPPISYRSPEWRTHFVERLRAAQGASTP